MKALNIVVQVSLSSRCLRHIECGNAVSTETVKSIVLKSSIFPGLTDFTSCLKRLLERAKDAVQNLLGVASRSDVLDLETNHFSNFVMKRRLSVSGT